MSNEEYFERVLYNKKMSVDWLALLENAPDFNRFDLKPISALLSAPCDLGTVIVRDKSHSFCPSGTSETLKLFYRSHLFLDYSATRRCFQLIEGFPSYKIPFVNWHYILCPLESSENGMWLNPLEVYDMQVIEGACFVELINGLVLELPIQRRAFLKQTERAVYSLCYLRREFMITLQYNGQPLDFIQLADTPFLKSLKKRSFLHHWHTDRGTFHQRYYSETLLQHKETK